MREQHFRERAKLPTGKTKEANRLQAENYGKKLLRESEALPGDRVEVRKWLGKDKRTGRNLGDKVITGTYACRSEFFIIVAPEAGEPERIRYRRLSGVRRL